MQCRTSIFLILAVAALTVAAVPAANAGPGPCVREAKRDAKDCTAGCKEAFQTAKDACLNRDHDCVEVCRANRSQCRLDTGFDAAIDACNDLLESRRADCRANHPPGADRDHCIDTAQVQAFQCRDAARELAKPLLRHCRKDFRNCAKACAPADPATPSLDPKQCIHDAGVAAGVCNADCKEQFQVSKDDCKHRNHECVEQCRADRNVCRQPIRDTLDAALADCAAHRQAGINDCETKYPPPRDETAATNFDGCVDGVQVDAFICRDNAHEAAAPGFANCRQQFRSCVQTNCPILP